MNKQKGQVLSLAPLPQKFNWKLYQKIANSSFIKNEETAVIHFRKNAQLDSALRNKYFREHLHIPEEFDEELYIELLKNDYNIKMKSGSVSHEKLYMFYETQGKKKYPLNDAYYKKFYKIPSEFNEELYKSVYMFSNKKNEFNEKINKAKNIYEVYHKYKTEFPIDDGYLKKFYNIPHIFDPNIYNKIYNVSSDTSEIYKHCVNNKNAFLNNETYLRTYYAIPESFNEKKYVERYPDVEKFLHARTLQEKYETLVKLILQKPLDAEYYKLLDGLNIKEYKELVLNKTSITNDEAYHIYRENETQIQAKQIQAQQIQAKQIQAKPIQAQQIQAKQIQAKPIQAKPIQAKPIQAPQIQAPQIQAPQIQAKQIQAQQIQAPQIQAPQIQAPNISMPYVEVVDMHANSEDKYITFYNFFYNNPSNLNQYLQDKYNTINSYLNDNNNTLKMSLYQENFYNNYIDPSLIPHNNITKYEFIQGNLSEINIKNYYDYSNKTTQIITKFNNAYNSIGKYTNLIILRNRIRYYDVYEFCIQVYTTDNSQESFRGILCNNAIQNEDIEKQCIRIINTHEILYNSVIEFKNNIKLLNKKKHEETISIHYLVPSNQHYHYTMLIKNLLYIQMVMECNYAITIFGPKESSEFSTFKKELQHNTTLKLEYQYVKENNLEEIYAENIDLIFSSNVYFNNVHYHEPTTFIKFLINNPTLAKSIKIKSTYK